MDSKQTITPDARLRRRRRISEIMASVGMVVIALSLFLPLLNLLDTSNLQALCWPFAIGTVLFWAPGVLMSARRMTVCDCAVCAVWNSGRVPVSGLPHSFGSTICIRPVHTLELYIY